MAIRCYVITAGVTALMRWFPNYCLDLSVGELHDFPRDLVEVQDFVDRTPFDCFLGHSVDHTTLLVLSNRFCPRLMQLNHTLCAIITHACHDDANRIEARGLSNGTKQDVHRWLVTGDRQAIS